MSRMVGVLKEIKDQEGRISMQPDGIKGLVHHGHEVFVEKGPGRAPASPKRSTNRPGLASWIPQMKFCKVYVLR